MTSAIRNVIKINKNAQQVRKGRASAGATTCWADVRQQRRSSRHAQQSVRCFRLPEMVALRVQRRCQQLLILMFPTRH
jgi:hypothetical protein